LKAEFQGLSLFNEEVRAAAAGTAGGGAAGAAAWCLVPGA
jgi:hypothetical protein